MNDIKVIKQKDIPPVSQNILLAMRADALSLVKRINKHLKFHTCDTCGQKVDKKRQSKVN